MALQRTAAVKCGGAVIELPLALDQAWPCRRLQLILPPSPACLHAGARHMRQPSAWEPPVTHAVMHP